MLRHKALGAWFGTLCRRLRIEPSLGGRRPSLQALRHRFAIERIRQWYRDGVDVQALLPNLSVYLGTSAAAGELLVSHRHARAPH